MNLKYVRGDATAPKGKGKKVVVHCCNDEGGWGAGFVLAISKKFPHVERAYRQWASTGFSERWGEPFVLGRMDLVPVREILEIDYEDLLKIKEAKILDCDFDAAAKARDMSDLIKRTLDGDCPDFICNLIGQRSVRYVKELPPIRYGAIYEGLIRLREYMQANYKEWSLHMPRMGTGLSGGKWEVIEDIITQVFSETNIDVFVYDLP